MPAPRPFFPAPVPAVAGRRRLLLAAATFALGLSLASVQAQTVDTPRPVTEFGRIQVEGAFDVVAQPGAKPSLVVRADAKSAAEVVTEVRNDTLIIKSKGSGWFGGSKSGTVQVLVQFTRLTSAKLAGSGDLTVTALKGDSFDASLSGSGDIRLKGVALDVLKTHIAGSGNVTAEGSAKDAQYAIAGAGDVHARDLHAQRVDLSLAGAGDADVYASEQISVRIAGAGNVRVHGNPAKIVPSIAGPGKITSVR